MKRFKFSLQAVHLVRESKCDTAERELVFATRELGRAHDELSDVLRQRQAAVDAYLALHQAQPVQAPTMAAHMDYIGALLERERQARKAISNHERNVAAKREALIEASRQAETTANLRERQRERYQQEVARDEQKMLDELAVSAVARRLSNN